MKAMTKSELADAAGVSVTTLMKWCSPWRPELEAMGVRPSDRMLPPRAVKLIAERLDIDIDE